MPVWRLLGLLLVDSWPFLLFGLDIVGLTRLAITGRGIAAGWTLAHFCLSLVPESAPWMGRGAQWMSCPLSVDSINIYFIDKSNTDESTNSTHLSVFRVF